MKKRVRVKFNRIFNFEKLKKHKIKIADNLNYKQQNKCFVFGVKGQRFLQSVEQRPAVLQKLIDLA